MSESDKRSFAVVKRPTRQRLPKMMSSFQQAAKRGFDIAFATAGLVLLSPLFLLVSLVLALDSPGPILCRHKRYGFHDVAFEIFEFRKAPVGLSATTADHMPDAIMRVTRVGQVLRSTGMSKLPQLVNILHGDMSIVGPRPFTTRPAMIFQTASAARGKAWAFEWSQLDESLGENAHTCGNLDRCIECDRYYLENRSLLLDAKILVFTLFSLRTYL